MGGVLGDAYTPDEAEGLLPGLCADWFPEGFGLERDQDSPNAWVATSGERKVWLFLEPVGDELVKLSRFPSGVGE